jgi:bacillithiol biosynthesis cysteine-adding enzyme BshC
MAKLFRGRGLIYFDARDADAKRLVAPLFQQVIRNSEHVHLAMAERSRMLLADGYHAQVNVMEGGTVLFCQEAGERRAIIREGGGFRLKNGDLQFSRDELLQQIAEAPERFSPNVLLRPLVQDHLFPTVAYVGGPAEVAYFGQISALYSLLDRPAPAIWPRASFTLLDESALAVARRYQLELEDCFAGKEHLTEKMLRVTNGLRESRILEELRGRIESELGQLKPEMVEIDATLGAALDTAQRKMIHNVDHLLSRFVRQQASRTAVLQHAELFLGACYPNKNLQERELGVHSFLAQRGPSLMTELYSAVQPERFLHKVLELE